MYDIQPDEAEEEDGVARPTSGTTSDAPDGMSDEDNDADADADDDNDGAELAELARLLAAIAALSLRLSPLPLL